MLLESTIGRAIAYSLSRWGMPKVYATYGILEIDNNLIENCIRPIAPGRKNCLFADSHSAATIYSLLLTCKLRDVEPFSWHRHVREVITDFKVNHLHELWPQVPTRE